MGELHDHDVTGSRRPVIRLAPGSQLSSAGSPAQSMLLVLAAGNVHLNQHAMAILELCDGSRSRDRLVVDAMLRAPGALRAADVVEFLDAAQLRGWIVETE
jgi:hypothetical protein